MEKIKEELNKYFWHRLYKVILWLGSFLVAFSMTFIISIKNFAQFSKIFVIFFIFTFLFIFIAYRLVLYITIGGKLFFNKKDWIFFIEIIVIFILIICSILFLGWYRDRQTSLLSKNEATRFHNAEIAYQKCLNKVDALTDFSPSNYKANIYYDEWKKAGSPNYIMGRGHWEWGVISWLIKNHSDFCVEFDLNLIKYYLGQQTKITGVDYLK